MSNNNENNRRSEAAYTQTTPRAHMTQRNMPHTTPRPPDPTRSAGAAPTVSRGLAPVAPSTPPPSAAKAASSVPGTYAAAAPIPHPAGHPPSEASGIDRTPRPSPARDRVRKRRGRQRTGGEWAWVIIAGALLSVVIVLSMSVTLILRTSQDGVAVMPTSGAFLPTPVDARVDFDGQNVSLSTGGQLTLDDGRSIVLQPWTGGSRLTILVMGLDRRPGDEGLSYRTDTMMLVSLDRDTNSLGILSIPRDLYVAFPGYSDRHRINEAMVYGELQQPDYGPVLAMQTAQYNFGMYVHNYVALDFNAVIGLIDAIGGLDIDVPYAIADYQYPDMNYGYDPLILQAGLQHMDGTLALKFARTRHGDNDFERARRQQMVLYALRDRVLDLNMLPQLIVQTPSLIAAFQNNVYTGLSTDQIIQLALSLKDIPSENIHTGVIDSNYTVSYTTEQGAQVEVPRQGELGALLTSVFGADYSESQ